MASLKSCNAQAKAYGFLSALRRTIALRWACARAIPKCNPAGPAQVGTQLTLVRVLMGRKLETKAAISEYEPPARYAYQSMAGYAVTGVNTCEATSEGTKVTTRFKLQIGGLFPLAEPVVGRSIKRGVQNSLATLKDLLESRVEVGSS